MPLHAGTLPLSFSSRGEIPTLAPMLAQAIPGVVSISVVDAEKRKSRSGDRLPRDPLRRESSGLGSGVIIDHYKGYIITNHHLIDETKEIEVALDDGRTFLAEQIGSDQGTDIALLRIHAPNLQTIPLGDSSKLRVGDFVIAIGNPFGLGNTATSGIVSALGRSNLGLERFEEFIQTDASINIGNSGGALLNLRGELIGINTAILAPNGGSVGIGFAIPVNMVREITAQLMQHGAIQRGYLGITSKELSANLARSMRLGAEQGVLITEVKPSSPAERARVQKGDVLTAINGHNISSPPQLQNVVGLFSVGQQLNLSILRGGHTRQLVATLMEPAERIVNGSELHPNMDGVVLIPLLPQQQNRYPSGGVTVSSVDPERAGWLLGLRSNDIIFSINRQPVNHLDDARKAAALSTEMVIVRVYRGDKIIEMIMR